MKKLNKQSSEEILAQVIQSEKNHYNKHICFELRKYKQWILVNRKREPINPKTGELSDLNNPSTWTTFAEAVDSIDCYNIYLGFVVTENDPYTCFEFKGSHEKPLPLNLQNVSYSTFSGFPHYMEEDINHQGFSALVMHLPPLPFSNEFTTMKTSNHFMLCSGDRIECLNEGDAYLKDGQLYIGTPKLRFARRLS